MSLRADLESVAAAARSLRIDEADVPAEFGDRSEYVAALWERELPLVARVAEGVQRERGDDRRQPRELLAELCEVFWAGHARTISRGLGEVKT